MEKKLTTYQMAVTALMAAVMCVLGPLTVPIGAVPISLANFVICLTAWLLGPKFGTLSVAVYLCIGLIGVPVFSGYGAGLAKLAGPTGGYLVGYLLLAFIGGLFIEKSKGQPVISGIGRDWGSRAACRANVRLLQPAVSAPSTRTCPPLRGSSRAAARSSVDLPQPLGPASTVTSPG
mgnify:FL=1